MSLRIKRVYEPKENDDGVRILVDRLWPRGMSKETAGIDIWLKDIAPSSELRRWYDHDPAKWTEFRRRYRQELEENPAAVDLLRDEMRKASVTLLFGARDTERNQAVALLDFMNNDFKDDAASHSG